MGRYAPARGGGGGVDGGELGGQSWHIPYKSHVIFLLQWPVNTMGGTANTPIALHHQAWIGIAGKDLPGQAVNLEWSNGYPSYAP